MFHSIESPLIAINALDDISDMLENKSNGLTFADTADERLPPSIISDVNSGSVDDETSVTELEPNPQPRVTFADRVRISSGVHLRNRGSSRRSPNPRRRPKLNSPRDGSGLSCLLSPDGPDGGTPSPSLSRSSSLSDSASSMSVPLRPPSLVTPQAYAFSPPQRQRNSARLSGSSLSSVMSSSDASSFLAGLRGSIKRPQKQHAARPANLDADLAASAQSVEDDGEDSDSSLQEDENDDEYENGEAPDETTPLQRGFGERRNRQTLRTVARRYRYSEGIDNSDDDGPFSCFKCFTWQVRIRQLLDHHHQPIHLAHSICGYNSGGQRHFQTTSENTLVVIQLMKPKRMMNVDVTLLRSQSGANLISRAGYFWCDVFLLSSVAETSPRLGLYQSTQQLTVSLRRFAYYLASTVFFVVHTRSHLSSVSNCIQGLRGHTRHSGRRYVAFSF